MRVKQRAGERNFVLPEPVRLRVAMMVRLGLWTQAEVAASYGVSRKTVQNCVRDYGAQIDAFYS